MQRERRRKVPTAEHGTALQLGVASDKCFLQALAHFAQTGIRNGVSGQWQCEVQRPMRTERRHPASLLKASGNG
jgi:hypothetical protein